MITSSSSSHAGTKPESEPLLQSESYLTHDDSDSETSVETSGGIADIKQEKSGKKAVNFFRAFLIPGVIVVGTMSVLTFFTLRCLPISYFIPSMYSVIPFLHSVISLL